MRLARVGTVLTPSVRGHRAWRKNETLDDVSTATTTSSVVPSECKDTLSYFASSTSHTPTPRTPRLLLSRCAADALFCGGHREGVRFAGGESAGGASPVEVAEACRAGSSRGVGVPELTFRNARR